MSQTRSRDLRQHTRVVGLCSPDFLGRVSINIWLWMAFAGNRDSRVGLGGRSDPLGFARAAEAEPRPATADYADYVRSGTLSPSAISFHSSNILLLRRSTCHSLRD